jgi:flagellar basal-body rod protein FlgC
MIDPLKSATDAAVSGLAAQSIRMRVIAENVANAQSTGATPGAEPYRRKTVSFARHLDALSGLSLVKIGDIKGDASSFPIEFRPGHPAANADGNVKMPNVNMILEMADMREAARSYEANLQVIKQSREMRGSLIDLLRSST